MYIGADFLLDRGKVLYLSEVNTGVPAGATEYDLVHRSRHGRGSGIFERLDTLSRAAYGRSFAEHIQGLPWLDDLRRLKIGMDGRGPLPENPHPALRLEDKWVQHRLLSPRFPMPDTVLWTGAWDEENVALARQGRGLILKRRVGRGGRGLIVFDEEHELNALNPPPGSYVIQPLLDSRIGPYAFSIRAAGFAGEFLGMFASLAKRATSNHGIRFFITEGDRLSLSNPGFGFEVVHQISREAELFYRGRIPRYLERDVGIEHVADAAVRVPAPLLEEIRKTTAFISRLYADLDFEKLPRSWTEEAIRKERT
jgi:hypothetical protein